MTYVMSDIHGRIRPYHRMLKKIGFCEDDTLYILGDVIDRNPSGIPILKEIMDTPNIRLLLGNHEYMMRDFLDTDQQDDLDAWVRKMDRWCNRNGGWVTYHAFLRESQRAQDRILAFLHRLPVNIEISVGGRRILLVHASPTFLYSESRPGMKDETEFAVWNRLAPGSGLDFPQDLIQLRSISFFKKQKFIFRHVNADCCYCSTFEHSYKHSILPWRVFHGYEKQA